MSKAVSYRNKLQKAVKFINSEFANSNSIYWRKQNNNKLIKDAIFYVYQTSVNCTIKKLLQEQGDKFIELIPINLRESILQNIEVDDVAADDVKISTDRLWNWVCSRGNTELRKVRSISTLNKVIRPFCSTMCPDNQNEVKALQLQLEQFTARAGMVSAVPSKNNEDISKEFERKKIERLSSLSSLSSKGEVQVDERCPNNVPSSEASEHLGSACLASTPKLFNFYESLCSSLDPPIKIESKVRRESISTESSIKVQPAQLLIPSSWLDDLFDDDENDIVLPTLMNENVQNKMKNEELLYQNIEMIEKVFLKPITMITIPVNPQTFCELDFLGFRGETIKILISSIEQKCRNILKKEKENEEKEKILFSTLDITVGIRSFPVSLETKEPHMMLGQIVAGVWITDSNYFKTILTNSSSHQVLSTEESLKFISNSKCESLFEMIKFELENAIRRATRLPIPSFYTRTPNTLPSTFFKRSIRSRLLSPIPRELWFGSTPYHGNRLYHNADYHENKCLIKQQTGKTSLNGKKKSNFRMKKINQPQLNQSLVRKAKRKLKSKMMKKASLTRT